jgi:hypothetical protein
MVDMGRYFEPPRRTNRQLWSLIEALADTGYRFHSEGGRAILFGAGKSGTRTPSTRAIMGRIKTWLKALIPLRNFQSSPLPKN